MALSLANLLTEYKLAIRDTAESDPNCYAALNSVKDEFQNRAIAMLGANALNATASTLTITLTSAYSYSLATASPSIGRIIDVKLGDGTYYRPMRQTEGLWSTGMDNDSVNPEYRINGNYLEIKFEPSGYVVVSYAPQIATVSDSYTGDSTTQSYQIDEVDRAWAWYAAARHFEANWEDRDAGRCRMVSDNKLYSILTGDAI